MKIYWSKLLGCLALPLAVGGLSAWLTSDAMKDFSRLNQPPLSPPGWVFSVVWPILYLMMGLASYLVWTSRNRVRGKKAALWIYLLQLFFNFWWSIFFFSFKAYLLSFIWLVLLWGLIALTAVLFRRFSRAAFWLLVPYFAWVTFAGYLNFGVYLLN